MTVWTDELLDALREIGDPHLDDVVEGAERRRWRDVAVAQPEASSDEQPRLTDLLSHWRAQPDGAVPAGTDHADGDGHAMDYWNEANRALDPESIRTAQGLFIAYGSEIAATLLLVSLPHAYAAEAGAAVLARTGEFRSNARRRIGETSQLLIDVLLPDERVLYEPRFRGADDETATLLPGGRAYATVRTTRLVHAVVRELIETAPHGHGWDPDAHGLVAGRPDTKLGRPVNQEDLLGTLVTFTVTIFEVAEKLGIGWSDDARAAYVDLWDRVAENMGIGDEWVLAELKKRGVDAPGLEDYDRGLRPKTPEDARVLADKIRDRNWPHATSAHPLGPFSARNGKLLVRALLDELQAAMPAPLAHVPQMTMRYLIDPDVSEALGLGGGGFAASLLRWPGEGLFSREPRLRPGRRAVERIMRTGAREVSRRAILHFIDERSQDQGTSDFRFPVFDDAELTIPRGRAGRPGA